ncbi:MAG: SGNH/GDSL hydrolase family protein [Polyangiaceae bacterium]
MTNLKLALTKTTTLSALASTLTLACLACGSGVNPGAPDGVGDALSAPPAAHPGHAMTSGGVTAATDGGAALGSSRETGPDAGSATPEAGTPAPVATQPGRMPLISGGLPAYASYASSPASNAVDADYSTVWRSGHDPAPGDTNWIALDLSSVPVASRTSVYSVWFNEYGYNYDTSDGPSYTLPGDFTIEANAGPGGGQPPTAGWTTLVTKTGNLLSSGANLLDLTGYEWVRFNCSATATNAAVENTDTSLQWGLYDAHAGNDGWKFGGDSITANSMGHQLTNDSFDQLVHAKIANDPAFEMAGHGGWSTATELANIDAFLADFPGRYYGLSLGTNDAPGNDPAAYLANMTQLVDTVLAAGKVPVIPTIPYTGEPTHATIPEYNAQIQTLYATYGSKLVHGPDLYSVIYAGRATMFTNPTDLHPNAVGNAAIRQAWAAAMLANVYGQ